MSNELVIDESHIDDMTQMIIQENMLFISLAEIRSIYKRKNGQKFTLQPRGYCSKPIA